MLIHNALGEDAQIFTDKENPTSSGLWKKLNSVDDDSAKSFETIVKEDYEKIKKDHPEVIDKIRSHKKFIKSSKEYKRDEMFMFAFTSRLIPITFDENGEPTTITLEEVYDSVKCEYDEKDIFNKDIFSWDRYGKLRDYFLKDVNLPPKIQPNSTHAKALNNLKGLLSRKPDFIRNYLKETKALHDLIKDTEIVSIRDMKSLVNLNDVNDIENLLDLYKEYCKDNTIKASKINKNVIIALENREKDLFS